MAFFLAGQRVWVNSKQADCKAAATLPSRHISPILRGLTLATSQGQPSPAGNLLGPLPLFEINLGSPFGMDSSDSQSPPPNLYDPFQFLGQRGNYKGTLFVSVSTLTIYIYISSKAFLMRNFASATSETQLRKLGVDATQAEGLDILLVGLRDIGRDRQSGQVLSLERRSNRVQRQGETGGVRSRSASAVSRPQQLQQTRLLYENSYKKDNQTSRYNDRSL